MQVPQFIRQLGLLLWKNALVQMRSIWWTIFELIPPLLLIVPSIVLSAKLATQASDLINGAGGGAIPRPFPIEGSTADLQYYENHYYQIFQHPYIYCFTPNTGKEQSIMDAFIRRFPASDRWKAAEHRGFDSETEMENFLVNEAQTRKENNTYFGGIVFSSLPGDAADAIQYTIRLTDYYSSWLTDRRSGDPLGYSQRASNYANAYGTGYPRKPPYFQQGFLPIQHALNLAIASQHYGATQNVSVRMGALWTPKLDMPIVVYLMLGLPTAIAIGFLFSIMYITRNVVQEKETRIKEYMKVMGLSNWMHWVAHLTMNLLKLLITVVVSAILLSTMVIAQSDGTIVFVFLLLYAIAVICLAFAVSTLFRSGNPATFFVTLLWMVMIGLAVWAQFAYTDWPFWAKMLASVNINTALSFGLRQVAIFDALGKGAQWSTLFDETNPDDTFTVGHAMGMLLVDIAILSVFTGYVDAVNPGGDAVAQPPWFPFLPSYWFPDCTRRRSPAAKNAGRPPLQAQLSTVSRDGRPIQSIEEADPEGVEPSIAVENLGKTWGAGWASAFANMLLCERGSKRSAAVKGVSLRMFPNQVTALLGHNGAGKSTTFAMLTGMTPPTKGTAYINGYDIRNALPSIRKSLGLCPQYNTLIPSLTVQEHLKFFCKLKGQTFHREEMMRLLDGLSLTPKINTQSKELSGGMKRKLSLAIALIGGSTVVVLDEPTSGMDPGARHETWTLLQKEKAGRTMLLTTHYMEEADLLGDRIAILAKGRLQCCGSSLFLKNYYGAGYHVTTVFNRRAVQTHGAKIARQSLAALQAYCPDVQLETFAGSEAIYLLPVQYRQKFKELFEHLESTQEELAIETFGVSVTTMEEVFLKVGEIADGGDDKNNGDAEAENGAADDKSDTGIVGDAAKNNHFDGALKPRRMTGIGLWAQQLKAMLIKRFLYFYRHWTLLVPQTIIPTLIFLGGVLVANGFDSSGEPTVREQLPALVLRVPESHVIVAQEVTASAQQQQLMDKYTSLMSTAGMELERLNLAVNETLGPFVQQKYKSLGTLKTLNTYQVGIELNGSGEVTVTALFNAMLYHTSAMALNVLDTALLRMLTNNDRITIQATNHPLPPIQDDNSRYYSNTSSYKLFLLRLQGGLIAVALVFCYALVAGSFAVFVVRERSKNVKHMQLLTGLSPFLYWLSTMLWDFVTFLLPIGLTLLALVAFNISAFVDYGEWASTLLVLLCYAFGVLPLVYLFTFMFQSPTKAYLTLLIFLLLSGLISTILEAYLTVSVTRLCDPTKETCSTLRRDAVRWLLLALFPTFGLGRGATLIYTNTALFATCHPIAAKCANPNDDVWHFSFGMLEACCGKTDTNGTVTAAPQYVDGTLSAFYEPGIGRIVVVFLLQGCFYWALIALIEGDYMRRFCCMLPCCSCSKPNRAVYAPPLDGDVAEEKRRVETVVGGGRRSTVGAQPPVVVVRNLCKNYGSFPAVRDLNVAVDGDECFGLLGVNGAGKTSTFEMLVGKQTISGGDAVVKGHSVAAGWRAIGSHVGYCPQFDAVLKDMTGEETLSMYARLRGVPERDIPALVACLAKEVGITIYTKKQIGTYSGGNRRKLSLAIALVAVPDVLFLDEPTTGVDPASRRAIWSLLAKVRSHGTAIILTSHSMEECEALCTRLAIMVAGQFQCIGSTQHLKHKFGGGYTLQLKVEDANDVADCMKAVTDLFPSSVLKECHHTLLTYDVGRTVGLRWSEMFGRLEGVVDRLHIVDYSLSQTTLERVFLQLTKHNSAMAATGPAPPVGPPGSALPMQTVVSTNPPPPQAANFNNPAFAQV